MPRKSYYDRQPKKQKQFKTQTASESRRGGIISITATPALLNALSAYCTREGLNRSEYVRHLIATALAEYPELFDEIDSSSDEGEFQDEENFQNDD